MKHLRLIIAFISIKQIALAFACFIAFDITRKVTANAIPFDLFALILPSFLIGLVYLTIPLGVIFTEVLFWHNYSKKLIYANTFFLVCQHILILLAMTGGILAVYNGAYLDGTKIPRWHIWSDQNIYIFLAGFHVWASFKCVGKKLNFNKNLILKNV